MSYDKQLISEVLAVFLRAVQGWYKQKAKEEGYLDVQGGAVSFVQKLTRDLRFAPTRRQVCNPATPRTSSIPFRMITAVFGSSLNLTPHFHSLLLDGAYVFSDNTEQPFFFEAPTPTDEDIKAVTETTASRVLRLLERRGVIGEQDLYDPFSDENPLLAGMTAASVQGMIATGDRAGLPVRRVLSDPAQGVRTSHLCYVSRGFSLHAARRVEADDREGLEQLCSYVTRPPLAAGSLEKVADDKYLFKMKCSWNDGTSHLILSGHELLKILRDGLKQFTFLKDYGVRPKAPIKTGGE